MAPAPLAIVTDFDGTLTREDVGNELCIEACPDLFQELHAALKSEKITLLDYQEKIWSSFPMNEATFRARARAHGQLRPGVIEFLEACADEEVAVYVASCGLRPYIEEVLDATLSRKALAAVVEVRCNEAKFGPSGIVEFRAPRNVANSPWPLDKGHWAQELKAKAHSKTNPFHVIGIGNGTSDRSLCGQVDLLLATDGLARFCDREKQPYSRFDDFFEVRRLVKDYEIKIR